MVLMRRGNPHTQNTHKQQEEEEVEVVVEGNSYIELLEVVDVSEDDSGLEEEGGAQQDPGWAGIDDHLRAVEGKREGKGE